MSRKLDDPGAQHGSLVVDQIEALDPEERKAVEEAFKKAFYPATAAASDDRISP